MELQAEAERRKRAQILESEGTSQAKVNVAEARKQEQILGAEALQTEVVLVAEARTKEVVLAAEGESVPGWASEAAEPFQADAGIGLEVACCPWSRPHRWMSHGLPSALST